MGAPPAPGRSLIRIDRWNSLRPPPAVANLGSRPPSLLHLLVAAAAAESRQASRHSWTRSVEKPWPGPPPGQGSRPPLRWRHGAPRSGPSRRLHRITTMPANRSQFVSSFESKTTPLSRVISNAATAEVLPYGARTTRKEGRLGGGYRVCCGRRHMGMGWPP